MKQPRTCEYPGCTRVTYGAKSDYCWSHARELDNLRARLARAWLRYGTDALDAHLRTIGA